MKKIRTKISKAGKASIILEGEGLSLEVPTKFLKKSKVGSTIMVTFATEKEDAASSREIAHELIRKALRGE